MQRNLIVRQNDSKDCGICCLESIIKNYNGYIPLEVLRNDTKTDQKGTTAYNLLEAAEKYGFTTKGCRTEDLNQQLILPAIAHIVTEKGYNHFVVIYKITKNYVYLMDPGRGYVKESKEIFIKKWTNILLIIKPYREIPKYKEFTPLNKILFQTIKEEKNLIGPIIIKSIIITFFSIITSYFLKSIITLSETYHLNIVIYLIISFLIITIIKTVLEYEKNNLTIYLNKNINIKIMCNFLEHLFKLPLKSISSRTSGEIITRINEINEIKDFFSSFVISSTLNIPLFFISSFFLYNINNSLFVVLSLCIIIYIICNVLIIPTLERKTEENINYRTEYNSITGELIDSIETIKNNNIVPLAINKVEDKFCTYEKNSFDYSKIINYYLTIKNCLIDFTNLLIIIIGFYLVNNKEIELLSLITFINLTSLYINPIEDIISLIPKFILTKKTWNKINEFISIEEEQEGKKEEFLNGDIEFNCIKYSYANDEQTINNVSFKIKEKTENTIKGPSGIGKSTLMKMLVRNIDDYKGQITINGINIKDYSLNTIRNNILYVSQREKILSDTIKNNITLENDITPEELNEIINITHLEEILNNKYMRLDTILYDEGINLSGGEKQRIILARSLAKKPKILILDESLSEVDIKTEKDILKKIKKYLKGTTIIYISHKNIDSYKNIIEMGKIHA